MDDLERIEFSHMGRGQNNLIWLGHGKLAFEDRQRYVFNLRAEDGTSEQNSPGLDRIGDV